MRMLRMRGRVRVPRGESVCVRRTRVRARPSSSVVDGVGHNRGSVGNCVVSHDGGSVHSVVGKRGGVVDGVGNNRGSVRLTVSRQ